MASTDLTSTQMSPLEDIIGALKPCQFGAILDDLSVHGATLRAIPRRERVRRIVQVVRSLQTDQAAIAHRLITECSSQIGWSEAMTRYVLHDCLKLMSEAALHALLHDELGPESTEDTFSANTWRATQRMLVPPEAVVHVLSSTVPTTAIEAIVLSLAAGVPCLIRTSQHERAAGRFFLHALRYEAPELAEHVAVITWPHDDERFAIELAKYRPTIVFHGSDESLRSFRQSLPQELDIHGFGHRIGFGLITPHETLTRRKQEDLADQIALDATLFEGGGCMSMQTLFVLPHPTQRDLPVQLARLLVERSFPKIAQQFPRLPLPVDVAAQHMQELGVAAFSGQAFAGEAGNALVWREPALRSSPGWRHLNICSVPNLDAVLDAIGPYRDTLSTAGVYMHNQTLRCTATLLGQAGVRRICPIGRMQRPVLLRAHDGHPKIRPWFRLCDLEG